VTVVGIWAGLVEPGGGEQSSQRSTSISWHDFVRRDGAVVDSRLQLPLLSISVYSTRFIPGCLPNVAVCEVPKTDRFRMIDGLNFPNYLILQQQFSKQHIMRTVSQDMANGEDPGRCSIRKVRQE